MAKKKDISLFKYYLTMAVINALVIYITPSVFPDWVVLGTSTIPPLVAAIIAGALLTLIISFVEPFMKYKKWKVSDERAWALIYALVNVVSVWGIARVSIYTGVGISSFLIAIVLGIELLLIQWVVWKLMIGKM